MFTMLNGFYFALCLFQKTGVRRDNYGLLLNGRLLKWRIESLNVFEDHSRFVLWAWKEWKWSEHVGAAVLDPKRWFVVRGSCLLLL